MIGPVHKGEVGLNTHSGLACVRLPATTYESTWPGARLGSTVGPEPFASTVVVRAFDGRL